MAIVYPVYPAPHCRRWSVTDSTCTHGTTIITGVDSYRGGCGSGGGGGCGCGGCSGGGGGPLFRMCDDGVMNRPRCSGSSPRRLSLRDSLRLPSNGEEEVLPDGAAAAAALPLMMTEAGEVPLLLLLLEAEDVEL
uniref:Uncharacterized protein n=1 Tax=Mantoniella antarctica TaxID=81844 RepID=A0A7S0SQC4_9CHLO|mmetsp:Transcript_32506/g.81878  ORF Transcript_32506/g.81878 Transcript_32506/m.81878 type:complete len:135 (+) Transcript_32506:516-920(+)